MNAVAAPVLADANVRTMLAQFGLDVEYTRSEGNALHYTDEEGREHRVVDFACGFGSLMLGHNNSEIAERAKQILDAKIPVHTQLARHSHTNDLAAALNKIIQRELGTDEPYYALFGNSGAEAVEIAIKHAEFDRLQRAQELLGGIEDHISAARAAVTEGTAQVSPEAYDQVGVAGSTRFEDLIAEVRRRNEAAAATPPLFLTIEGSFHGKLASSIQLTYNEMFRTPFKALSAQARFVPADQPDALAKIVSDERVPVLDVVVEDGTVRVVERDFPVFGAFFLEPIRGEAGIRPLSREFAQVIEQVCAELGCPVVSDEIQCGTGRSGAFFAASHIGLRGDYIILAKSLAGGIAKTGVVLVREGRYRQDFELIHSSTFGKDSFSSLIALKVIEMLEADGGQAYRAAVERGDKLKAMLEAVRADFPDVVKDVRGRGLMLGLEFHDQSEAASEVIREQTQHGVIGFAVAGYLLRKHNIRTFTTASALHTFRFEPSIHLGDEDIAQLDTALRAVCEILRRQDENGFAVV
ncbi:diaminobutyrate--pyruvate aminotransferase [Streptomyces spinoverrucosus]|uniref:Diaminobutyrate--pyruvate aminotransferase n=1 Tax=Streptomyces spinoverrucosus TaxID=284043 RepID=A0A4Y3VQT2_9ACTN|nr:aminotransferase class III-fold pyridoxal phosphate-dependent enzyme [Streptomyces spinoverrucosus]GEC08111.1 diaminobutyrate--pyruvate aminotransferase [Streptomyces spinoverrucosus]GHB64736.1 diaminobutyrate--pyruvate aminotransferase [Streptomyces spinoverrucosus]